MLTFVVPVCHPNNAKSWPTLKSYLEVTLNSIAAQDCDEWQAVIVANNGVDLPTLPDKVQVCFVDFPPNDKYDKARFDIETVYDSFRFDKGRRVLAGALQLMEHSDYFMFVDCDDLVHKGLASYVMKNNGGSGWYLKEGYVWNDGGGYLLKYKDYSQLCGSSLIIHRDLLELPKSIDVADADYIKRMFGSHVANQDYFNKNNTPLSPLPFAGGVYRVAHSQAHSLSNSLLSMYLFNWKYFFKPHRFIINLLNLRRLNKQIRSNFFGLE